MRIGSLTILLAIFSTAICLAQGGGTAESGTRRHQGREGPLQSRRDGQGHLRHREPGEPAGQFHFTSGKLFDVWAKSGSEEVWRWSAGRMFTQALTSFTLASRRAEELRCRWNQKNRKGEQVGPGVVPALGRADHLRSQAQAGVPQDSSWQRPGGGDDNRRRSHLACRIAAWEDGVCRRDLSGHEGRFEFPVLQARPAGDPLRLGHPGPDRLHLRNRPDHAGPRCGHRQAMFPRPGAARQTAKGQPYIELQSLTVVK